MYKMLHLWEQDIMWVTVLLMATAAVVFATLVYRLVADTDRSRVLLHRVNTVALAVILVAMIAIICNPANWVY